MIDFFIYPISGLVKLALLFILLPLLIVLAIFKLGLFIFMLPFIILFFLLKVIFSVFVGTVALFFGIFATIFSLALFAVPFLVIPIAAAVLFCYLFFLLGKNSSNPA